VLPSALTDAEVPSLGWMWRSRMYSVKEHDTAAAGEILIPDKIHFDVRASRKVDRGILFLEVVTTTVSGSSESMLLRGLVRALCLT